MNRDSSEGGQPASAVKEGSLRVGYVSRAHGTQGEVAIRCFNPESESLFEVERLVLIPRVRDDDSEPVSGHIYRIQSVRPTPKEILTRLEGVGSRDASRALVGASVWVFREEIANPEEGEYFLEDLVGLRVEDESGRVLGRVSEVWTHGPVPNLVIRGDSTEELIVPFAEQFVPTVDLPKKRLVIRPPEYLE